MIVIIEYLEAKALAANKKKWENIAAIQSKVAQVVLIGSDSAIPVTNARANSA